MTLDEGIRGNSYIIESLSLPIEMHRRLEALGMIKGTTLHITNSKNNGTLIIKIRGTRFAIGKGITKNVQVSEAVTGGSLCMKY